MSAGYSLTTLDNFRGGLNYRTDAFDLELNESPDLLNVSVDPRGDLCVKALRRTTRLQRPATSKAFGRCTRMTAPTRCWSTTALQSLLMTALTSPT